MCTIWVQHLSQSFRKTESLQDAIVEAEYLLATRRAGQEITHDRLSATRTAAYQISIVTFDNMPSWELYHD